LKTKGRSAEKSAKRRERGSKRLKTMDLRPGQAAARRHRVRREIGRLVPPHPGAMGIVVKIKGLREKQFVRI